MLFESRHDFPFSALTIQANSYYEQNENYLLKYFSHNELPTCCHGMKEETHNKEDHKMFDDS